jgi:hypothetical protein
MGAEFWRHQTPYEPDAAVAFRRLQAALYVKAGYDLAKLLEERIRGMTESVRLCEKDDPYDLLEHYRDCLRRLRRLAARSIPEDPESQIALLRKIEAISSDSAPGLLALEGVSRRWAERKVQLLSAKRMKEVFGTTTPSLREARQAVARLADSIPRGSGICFPVYKGGQPVSWYFAGYTAD